MKTNSVSISDKTLQLINRLQGEDEMAMIYAEEADYMIDMGPGGGDAGETIVAVGTPEDIMASEQSITEKYLKTERG